MTAPARCRAVLALLLAPAALTAACATPAGAPSLDGSSLPPAVPDEDEKADGGGVVSTLVWYLPDRVLDVFDVVRARVRVGPGLAFGVRATEVADLFAGTYLSVYAGLPGPRGRRWPRLPVGLESRTGVEASVVDVTLDPAVGPDYGTFEVGLGLQALLAGFDVGLDPWEVVDLAAGLLTFDPADDDI